MVPRASGPVFMFCASGPMIDRTEGVGSCFHVSRSRTRFRWYRGCRASFHVLRSLLIFGGTKGTIVSCFYILHYILVLDGIEGVGYCFLDLRSQNRLRRCHRRRVPFSFFCALRPRPVFLSCAFGLVFGGTKGVGSSFLILRIKTRVRRYRGRSIQFLCFAPPDPFSSAEGVRFSFHVLRSRTHFRRY
jgi:hypothetical protein